MVDLPKPDYGIATSQAPQSAVTTADVASPHYALSKMLDQAGESAMDVAVPLAEQAGYKAVTRDAQGNVQFERLPIVGRAAAAYSRAVKVGALADGEGAARRADMALRQKYPDDPEGYLQAADGLKSRLEEQYSKSGAEVGMAIGQAVDRTTTQTYRSMLNEKRHRELAKAEDAIDAGMKDKGDQITALAELGGEKTPEFAALMRDYHALLSEKVNNPLFGYSKERGALEERKLHDQITVSTYLGGVRKTLASGDDGVEKASAAVESLANNAALSPTQRLMLQKYGAAEIKSYTSAIEKSDIIAKKIQKQNDEAASNAIISDSDSAKPTITDSDIKNDPKMSPEAKMRMLAWRDRDGRPDPISRVSQGTSADLFRRMNLPDDDPARIKDLSEIREAYAPTDGSPSKLTRADEEWLEKRFKEDRSPQGEALSKDREEFFKRYTATIDGGMNDAQNPAPGRQTPLGSQKVFEAQKDAARQEAQMRAKGEDPHQLYDPTSKFFLGRPEYINKFRVSLTDNVNYLARLAATPAATNAPSAAPAFKPPADWQFSPSRKLYRDPTGRIYDPTGRPAGLPDRLGTGSRGRNTEGLTW